MSSYSPSPLILSQNLITLIIELPRALVLLLMACLEREVWWDTMMGSTGVKICSELANVQTQCGQGDQNEIPTLFVVTLNG